MATAYLRNEPWEMGVHKRKGVVYLDVHKLPERPKSVMDRKRFFNVSRILRLRKIVNTFCGQCEPSPKVYNFWLAEFRFYSNSLAKNFEGYYNKELLISIFLG